MDTMRRAELQVREIRLEFRVPVKQLTEYHAVFAVDLVTVVSELNEVAAGSFESHVSRPVS